jgi:type I restriction enzyme, S subunit
VSNVASTITSRPLEDVFWFQEGPGVRKWQFFTEGIKLLNVANIEKQGRLNLAKTDRHLSVEEATGKYAHFLLDEGDLVIASSGISFDEDGLLRTRGAFVERAHLPLCLNTSTIRFKPKEGQSDLNFLRHWLNGLEFRTQITKLVTGSAQQNFGPTHLKALSISIPQLEEQRRIAAILDQAETLRTQRRQALAHLDTLTQSLFLNMFGDPLDMPMRWAWVRMSELFETSPIFGTMIPGDADGGSWLCLRVANIQDWQLTLEDKKYVDLPESAVKRHSVKAGDLLMARAIASQDHLGKCIVAQPGDEQWAFDSHLMRLRFRADRALPDFIRQMLRTPGGRKLFLKASRKSSVQYNINTKEISALEIPVPPLPLQQTFATRIQAIEALKATHRTALAQLDALFASLQQRAFAGAL